MIISRTPYRISLFGGGTDFNHWINNHGSNIISFSINKYCYLIFRELPSFFNHKHRFVYSDTELVNKYSEINHPSIRETLKYFNINLGFELIHYGDLPARSGLGSSSSFTVGLVSAINYLYNKKFTKKKISKTAILIEQNLIKENVGSQDQIAVTYGGLNNIIFSKKNDFRVNKITLSNKNLKNFEDSMMLVYSGIDRESNLIQKSIKKNNVNNSYLKKIHEISLEAKNYFNDSTFDIQSIGNLLNDSWEFKKKLSPIINKDITQKIIEKAKEVGIYGAKVIGAGSGGFVLLIFPKKNKTNLEKSLHNYITLSFKIDFKGNQILLPT